MSGSPPLFRLGHGVGGPRRAGAKTGDPAGNANAGSPKAVVGFVVVLVKPKNSCAGLAPIEPSGTV